MTGNMMTGRNIEGLFICSKRGQLAGYTDEPAQSTVGRRSARRADDAALRDCMKPKATTLVPSRGDNSNPVLVWRPAPQPVLVKPTYLAVAWQSLSSPGINVAIA